MVIYQHNNIAVRALGEGDSSLLVKWLSDPAVLEYYGGRDRPYDYELVRKHFYEDRNHIAQCIVEIGGRPIGYIQYYLISEEERLKYGYEGDAGSIYGMDQFIGEPDYWNRGIGTELVRSMVHYLLTYEQAGKIVMDPQTWNSRALRVYEKCGFEKKRMLPSHEWHEGEYKDCWLMEYEEPSETRFLG